MPPELLVDIDVPYEVLKSFYLLPSLMYRVESLMLACQLRKEISFCSSNPIPSFLILEAITTLRCCEDFSMERLELLGDSVLKYAVSCSLFLKFPGKHEGKLSSDRIKIIRNATLHSLGTKHGIQVQHHFHLFGFIFSRFYVKFFHQVINTHSKACIEVLSSLHHELD
ncbi:unnamed protein product [Musa hybrid cultivar]